MTAYDTEKAAGVKLSKQGRKGITAAAIGNTVEWVDWGVYAIFSSVFAHHFFPPGNDAAALLNTLLIFAAGFVMRPIGGLVLGAYADRLGRKKGLILTIGMMAGAGFIIAVLPTFSTIGYAAPIILLLARLAQGFSAGGEFGSSSAYMVEFAAPNRRAFAGSWQQVSVGAGGLLSSGLGYGITGLFPAGFVDSWGWRIAFAFGGVLGLVGLWLRLSVEETEAFKQVERRRNQAGQDTPDLKKQASSALTIFTHYPLAALRVFGITIAGTLLYYMWISYMPTYAHVTTGMPLNTALLANVISLIVFICLLPFGGLLSDIVGRKPTMSGFAAGFILLSWPAFTFMNGGFWVLLLIELIGVILMLGYSGNCATIMAEQFPPEVRSAGIGFPYAAAVAVFGGTAPYVTTAFFKAGHIELVWIYCAAAGVIGLIVYLTMPETKGKQIA